MNVLLLVVRVIGWVVQDFVLVFLVVLEHGVGSGDSDGDS